MRYRNFLARTATLAVALAASAAGAAAELSFAHYAPGAGDLRLQLDDGAERRLGYREFGSVEQYPAGDRRVRVRRADGSLLADSTLRLREYDRYVVVVAGNGSTTAPYTLRVSADHNLPMLDATTLQSANLAIVPGGGTLQVRRDCGFGNPPAQQEAYLAGTAPLDAPDAGSSNLSGSSQTEACRETLIVGGAEVARLELSVTPGARTRRFAIGDGLAAPYELVEVVQGVEREADLPLDASLEGLWYPPAAAPGVSVQFAWDPEQPEGRRLSALFLGYGSEGEPTWRVLDPDFTLVEYRGGNPDGTHATVPFRQTRVRLVRHGCNEMTIVPDAGTLDLSHRLFGEFPRYALRLAKLFPPGCSAPASIAQEATR